MKPRPALFVCLSVFAALFTSPATRAQEQRLGQLFIRNICPYDLEFQFIFNAQAEYKDQRRFDWLTVKSDPEHFYGIVNSGVTFVHDLNQPAYYFFRLKDHPEFGSAGGDFPVMFNGKRNMVKLPDKGDASNHIRLTVGCPDNEAEIKAMQSKK